MWVRWPSSVSRGTFGATHWVGLLARGFERLCFRAISAFPCLAEWLVENGLAHSQWRDRVRFSLTSLLCPWAPSASSVKSEVRWLTLGRVPASRSISRALEIPSVGRTASGSEVRPHVFCRNVLLEARDQSSFVELYAASLEPVSGCAGRTANPFGERFVDEPVDRLERQQVQG